MLLPECPRRHQLGDKDKLAVLEPAFVKVDDVWVADLFEDFNLLRELVEFMLRRLQTVPGNFDAFLAVESFVDDLVGAFAKNDVQL